MDDFDDKYHHVAIGKTGLAILAFLGAGHTHESDTRYSANVRRALAFLIDVQHQGSGHFGDSSAYSHGISTYAIAECYALTEDEWLLEPLEEAVEHIIDMQQRRRRDRRLNGGWGYYRADGPHFDNWPRVSVSSWQVMALESAQIGGLEVPRRVFEDARDFLRGSYDEQRQWMRYSHDPNRLNSNYPTLPGSTPAGLFALSLLGEEIDGEQYAPARQFILERRPRRYRRDSERNFVQRASGNVYFWYYSTLALFRCGGRDWERWNERMKEILLPAQGEDGSWDPISPYAGYAGDDADDKSYTTAMCVLTLEVYYRYFTPLLQVR